MQLFVYIANGYDAHKNQAMEAALTEAVRPDTVILYLWANDGVVFIGKNQNAFLECNLDLLRADGGVLARRITGGGAVYHDKGNLNYSFIAPTGLYDEKRQFEIILKAVKLLGLDGRLSGRNDVTIEDRKFSGNAFLRKKDFGLHHGTILITSDYQKIAKYLSVSKIKLKSKGVESVAARIINLAELKPDIDKAAVLKAVICAAEDTYGVKSQLKMPDEALNAATDRWHKFFTDEIRLLGTDIYYDARIEYRFDFGTCDIRLKMDKNVITTAKIYSDCLDTELIEKKENALIGQNIHNVTNADAKDILNVFAAENI